MQEDFSRIMNCIFTVMYKSIRLFSIHHSVTNRYNARNIFITITVISHSKLNNITVAQIIIQIDYTFKCDRTCQELEHKIRIKNRIT